MIRISAGTARILGLSKIKAEVCPTTAYILAGEKCMRSCDFCARSRTSLAGSQFLSRVTWPPFTSELVIEKLHLAYGRGDLGRVCLQVVHHRDAWAKARRVLETITQSGGIPASVSCTANSLADIQHWFAAGAERFGLALDAANESIYERVKGGDYKKTLTLLYSAAGCWPGRISTHLIAGLGETDLDIVSRLQEMADNNILAGLFAFTPVKGTGLQNQPPPALSRYRRLQAAHYLISRCGLRLGDFSFDANGGLISLGLPDKRLEKLLHDGDAFRTTGCSMCNRPFYNERPGGNIYNYPRPLTPGETAAALRLLPGAANGGICP